MAAETTEVGWVSVADRLPERGAKVLLAVAWSVGAPSVIELGHLDLGLDDTWVVDDGYDLIFAKTGENLVRYWMAIPPLPE